MNECVERWTNGPRTRASCFWASRGLSRGCDTGGGARIQDPGETLSHLLCHSRPPGHRVLNSTCARADACVLCPASLSSPIHARPWRPRGGGAVVPTLEELPDGAQVCRGTNWCQKPPAPLGLLLQRQLAPVPKGNPGGLQARGSNVYTPLAYWCTRTGAGEHSFPSCGGAGSTWPKQETCTWPKPQDRGHGKETQKEEVLAQGRTVSC